LRGKAKIAVFILVFFVSATFPGRAAAETGLTLQQAVTAALHNYPSIRVSQEQINAALVDLILSGIPIAHNSKMEQEWLSFFHGDRIVFNADWQDTMAQAYVLDEREGTKSLAHCTMSRLGLNVKLLGNVNVGRLEFEPLSRVLPVMGGPRG
jgi:hypothetical protein